MFVQWCIYFSCSESHIVSSWVYESHSVFNSLYFFEFSHDSGPGKKKSQFLIHTYNGKRNSAYALKLYKCSFSSDLLFVLMVCRSRSRSSAGQSVRTRRILQEAHEEGRPCPNQLTQTKPCAIRPCYTWLLSDWSPCTVEVWPTLWMLDLRFFFFFYLDVIMCLQRVPTCTIKHRKILVYWFSNVCSLEWHHTEFPHFLKVPCGGFDH